MDSWIIEPFSLSSSDSSSFLSRLESRLFSSPECSFFNVSNPRTTFFVLLIISSCVHFRLPLSKFVIFRPDWNFTSFSGYENSIGYKMASSRVVDAVTRTASLSSKIALQLQLCIQNAVEMIKSIFWVSYELIGPVRRRNRLNQRAKITPRHSITFIALYVSQSTKTRQISTLVERGCSNKTEKVGSPAG